jgi:hypothetical protein
MMQKNEKDVLPIFVAYYGNLFGYKNIYIFDNGSDKYMLDELRKSEALGCNVNFEFSSRADFERKGEILASYINGMTEQYDVFLPLDCDEFIGIKLRNINEEEIKGNYFIKYNQMNEISDLVITLTPLQLYLPNPSKAKISHNWLMELISEHSLKIVPSMFFKKGLHKNLNTSFI